MALFIWVLRGYNVFFCCRFFRGPWGALFSQSSEVFVGREKHHKNLGATLVMVSYLDQYRP